MNSKTLVHALTGECTGDCDTCGCPVERSASHTCCCWQKNLEYHDRSIEKEADCCGQAKKIGATSITKTCPCGNKNHLAFCSTENLLVVPNHYTAEIPVILEDKLHQDAPERLFGRTGEPPVPPPKLLILT